MPSLTCQNSCTPLDKPLMRQIRSRKPVLLVVCLDAQGLHHGGQAGYLNSYYCTTGCSKSSHSLPLPDSCLHAQGGTLQAPEPGAIEMAPPVPLNSCSCRVAMRDVTAHQASPPDPLYHNCGLQGTGSHKSCTNTWSTCSPCGVFV